MGDWSQGFQGAAGGAMAGSAFGPWGMAVGGGLGFLGGMMGDGGQSQYQDQLKQLAQQYSGRQAPQAGYSDFRGNQAGLIAQLEAAARGEGPSAAAMQMRDAMDKAVAAQTSAAAGAGGRGVNPGAAYRQAADNSAAIMQQNNRDTAVLRAQEQATARGQLGGVIAQGRGADEQINVANMEAKLRQLGLNDEAQLKALMGAMGAAGPGMGTQILAGGANAFPTAMQYLQRGNQRGGGGGMWSPAGLQNDQDYGMGAGRGPNDYSGNW